MPGQCLHVVAGEFFGRVSVDVAAEAFKREGKLPWGAPLGGACQEMLQHVGSAVVGRLFIAAAAQDPDADGHRVHRGNLLDQQLDAVGQFPVLVEPYAQLRYRRIGATTVSPHE